MRLYYKKDYQVWRLYKYKKDGRYLMGTTLPDTVKTYLRIRREAPVYYGPNRIYSTKCINRLFTSIKKRK